MKEAILVAALTARRAEGFEFTLCIFMFRVIIFYEAGICGCRYIERSSPHRPEDVCFETSVVEIFLLGGVLFRPSDVWLMLAFTANLFLILIGFLTHVVLGCRLFGGTC